ncbi:hypothetical protein [Bowmanella pacifica]|uniref:Uncharacterized protein n=1 Tax=Bowmanella pacifica TaxID=502051 RepID=A0A918DIZ1_9ALTE|nr:hypothetical protein [Bowmanella pacifica]GGO67651.1 hypothetical protein GCM10010982_14620 [Bowmanella pacifica]
MRSGLNKVAVPLFLALGLMASGVQADCLKDAEGDVICGKGSCARDSSGQVFCSAFKDGEAIRDRMGEVLCGKGQCRIDQNMQTWCSTTQGGGAERNDQGKIMCLEGCEPASKAMCEQTVATH